MTPCLFSIKRFAFCTILSAGSVITAAAGMTMVAPPTPEEIRAMQQDLREFYSGRTGTAQDREDLRTLGADLLSRIDVAACDHATLRSLYQILSLTPEGIIKTRERLLELGNEPTVAGCLALMDAVDYTDRDARPDLLKAILAHEALSEALRSTGEIRGVITAFGSLDAETLAAHRDHLTGLAAYFRADAPMTTFQNASDYIRLLIDHESAIPSTERERIRVQIVTAMREKLATLEEPEGRDAQFLTRSADYLDGAAMRGMLLNHEAPALDFTWIQGPDGTPPWTSLADLRGKVVVLDFWATWCGPCIATFPNVRELQAHYKDEDVVILGVTSLQGRHYPVGGTPVDCTDDPEREKTLMAEFMAENEITWTVAFGSQNVFNPDYGVRGIPHVAIIGRDGRVRHTGLHPGGALADKVEKIDALLAERSES